MRIRRKTAQTYDAVQYTGDLNALIIWGAAQTDFLQLTVGRDLAVEVISNSGNHIRLNVNDWLRVDDSLLLDKVGAAAFTNNWEVVP